MNENIITDNNLYLRIKNDLQNMTDEEANFYINMLLDDYERRKKENRLYQTNDPIPKIIIKSYYECVDSPDFNSLVKNFRRKYILNENRVESVHAAEEREGLRKVYEFIQNFNDINNFNIYTIMRIHQILFSKVPYPEVGGKFRIEPARIEGSGQDVVPYEFIPKEMANLYFPVQQLIKEGIEISYTHNVEKIIPFIDKCIHLKCHLIKIHPFKDGNGRSVRAFINLLFKLANIPPVYIRNKEKKEYNDAINLANNEGNYENIKTFYYYKVCDSILELDISYNEEKNNTDEKEESKKL